MSNFLIPSFTLGQLAQITNGELLGPADLTLKGVSPDPLKASKDELCLVFSNKFIKLLNEGKLNAGAYLIPTNTKISIDVPCIAVQRPKLIIKQLLEVFGPKRFSFPLGIHTSAVIEESAILGKNIKIGPFVYIGAESQIQDNTEIQTGAIIGQKVKIGSNCLIRSKVVIEDNTQIGNRVIIQPSAVIGADGFSYITEEESNLEKIQKGMKKEDLQIQRQIQLKVPSCGWVELGDDVEIGANACIDRGTMGPTIIGRGTKIDNLVQIAHNCKIGEDCLLVGQSGLAGSVIIGDRCIIAGHSGCKDNIEIKHDTIIVASSHAHKDCEPFSVLGGDPAIPAEEYIKKEKALRRAIREVPKIKEELKALKESLSK